MAIITIGVSVLPNHTHSTIAANNGGALSGDTQIQSSTLQGYILINGAAST